MATKYVISPELRKKHNTILLQKRIGTFAIILAMLYAYTVKKRGSAEIAKLIDTHRIAYLIVRILPFGLLAYMCRLMGFVTIESKSLNIADKGRTAGALWRYVGFVSAGIISFGISEVLCEIGIFRMTDAASGHSLHQRVYGNSHIFQSVLIFRIIGLYFFESSSWNYAVGQCNQKGSYLQRKLHILMLPSIVYLIYLVHNVIRYRHNLKQFILICICAFENVFLLKAINALASRHASLFSTTISKLLVCVAHCLVVVIVTLDLYKTGIFVQHSNTISDFATSCQSLAVLIVIFLFSHSCLHSIQHEIK